MVSELAELADLRLVRARLEEQELQLIERARHQGATWIQIAAALGLASRQAAQQRHQRLVEAARSRLPDLDIAYPPAIATLRRAVADLQRWIDADRLWDTRFVRAALVRSTVHAALEAAPGSLYALAAYIAGDLADAGVERLARPIQTVTATLNAALSIRN